MRTVYRTTGRYGGHRSLHTERDCPLLDQGRHVIEVDVETVDDDRLCSCCADEDGSWNQSQSDDWSYQKAIAEEAGVDGDLVTDGGEDVLGWTRGRYPHATGQRVLHTESNCRALQQAKQTRAVTDPDEADDLEDCDICAGECETSDPDWSFQQALRDARDEQIRTDGGHDVEEHERRARQAAHSLVEWCDRADVEPEVVLEDVREGIPSGRDPAHYCDICSTGFETIQELIDHDCEEEEDAPLVTDGGYDGAGDGQCLAIKNDGERCTNGTYGSDDLCGTHKRADDVQTVVDHRGDSA
ncbi:hypothetical protein [Haloplanus sp. C73]|uniref:hypothetical protein n=1 Tax=Haloplanus sp. C73 TaxID=3421641 RepID=UPI003EC0FCE6